MLVVLKNSGALWFESPKRADTAKADVLDTVTFLAPEIEVSCYA